MSRDKIRINEIAELFSDPSNIQKDMSEGIELVRGHFHKKYVSKMMKTIEGYQDDIRKNPSDEIRLLQAWMPFIPEESRERIDSLINMLYTYNMFKEMREGSGEAFPVSAAENAKEKFRVNSNFHAGAAPAKKYTQDIFAAAANSAVHPDGVYEIDETCYANNYGSRNSRAINNRTGMMMLMALMNGQ